MSLSMNHSPDLSLIISFCNQQPWATLILSSIEQQRSNARFEVILCDDGSTDDLFGTLRASRTTDRLDLRYVWQPDAGFRLARSRNNAIRLARGRILVFVDGDTWLSPDFLSMHLDAHSDDGTLVCGGRYTLAVTGPADLTTLDPHLLTHLAGHTQREYQVQRHWMTSSTPWMACLGGNFSVPAGAGLTFDEAFESWGTEDRDFAYRAYQAGARPRLLPRPNAVHLTLGRVRAAPMSHEEIVRLLQNKTYLAAKYPNGEMEPSLELIRFCHLDQESQTWRIGARRANTSTAQVLSEYASWIDGTPREPTPHIPAAEEPLPTLAAHSVPATAHPPHRRPVSASSGTTWPVFLLGCHRSGTTLLRCLLDAHPRLACPPESKFIAGLQKFYGYSQALSGLQSLGYSQENVLRDIRGLVTGVFSEYARTQGKDRWLDKTPNYYRILNFIDRVFEEQVLYVCLYRHPLDTVASLEQVRDFAMETPEDPDIALAVKHYGRSKAGWAAYWRKVNGTLTAFCRPRPRRCLELRYEALVARPEAELRTVLDFIEERWVDGLIEAAFTRRPTSGYQDWKIRSAAGVHAQSVGRWKAWPQDEALQAWSVAKPVAVPLGYAAPAISDFCEGTVPSTQHCQGGPS